MIILKIPIKHKTSVNLQKITEYRAGALTCYWIHMVLCTNLLT